MNEPTFRARAIGAAVLLAVFVTGAAVGVAVDRTVRPQPRIRMIVGADMSGVLDRLDLTSEQRARADAIIAQRAPRTEAMMLQLGERLRTISDSLDAELRTILTPGQRLRLDSLRSSPRIMLKRKVVGPDGATATDTVFPRRDSTRP